MPQQLVRAGQACITRSLTLPLKADGVGYEDCVLSLSALVSCILPRNSRE